jgi:spore germination cell wall hydrolase CwlJ-like protein
MDVYAILQLLNQKLDELSSLIPLIFKPKMRIVSDDTIAALNIWMEARSESFEGKVAVAEVMRNRLKNGWWGKTITEVILAPYQFSGWNTNDRNRIKAMLLDDSDPQYQECVKAWQTAKGNTNFTKGALFYFNPKLAKTPVWATPQRFLVTIGNHKFYSA